jgi:quinohemoprotein ethanol dehydrogenase
MSFSPKTDLVYIPYLQAGTRFSKGDPKPDEVSLGGVALGLVETDDMDGKGALLAWDPVHQKQAWRIKQDTYWNGGTLATAGNLVFQGTGDGYFSAYNATTGDRLWRFYAGLGIMAAPMSYSAGGKQYVSVLVGYGGSAGAGNLMNVGWKYTAPRRLLTFALDGRAALASTDQPDMTSHSVDNPTLKLNPADVEAGRQQAQACMLCHGRDLVELGGTAPDLRESQIALDPENIWNIVHDGLLIQNGMPRFEDLTHQQVLQIYAYIRSRARETMDAGPAEVKPAAAR